jgi:hypothetical protein
MTSNQWVIRPVTTKLKRRRKVRRTSKATSSARVLAVNLLIRWVTCCLWRYQPVAADLPSNLSHRHKILLWLIKTGPKQANSIRVARIQCLFVALNYRTIVASVANQTVVQIALILIHLPPADNRQFPSGAPRPTRRTSGIHGPCPRRHGTPPPCSSGTNWCNSPSLTTLTPSANLILLGKCTMILNGIHPSNATNFWPHCRNSGYWTTSATHEALRSTACYSSKPYCQGDNSRQALASLEELRVETTSFRGSSQYNSLSSIPVPDAEEVR